jgi:hypothetical protein
MRSETPRPLDLQHIVHALAIYVPVQLRLGSNIDVALNMHIHHFRENSNTEFSCLHLAFLLIADYLPHCCSNSTASQRKRRFGHQMQAFFSLVGGSEVTQRDFWIFRVSGEHDDTGSQGALYRKCVQTARQSLSDKSACVTLHMI